jgi:hypothetical protein
MEAKVVGILHPWLIFAFRMMGARHTLGRQCQSWAQNVAL